MLPFIGENYLEHRILVVDCCLEIDPKEYKADPLDNEDWYYDQKGKRNCHFKESVIKKIDSSESLFNLKKVLKTFDSGINQESVIFHSFAVRPIKSNEPAENYFPTGIGVKYNIDSVPCFYDEMTKRDRKESAKILIQLIHLCRPKLVIILGVPLYQLVFQGTIDLTPDDFKGETSLEKWIRETTDRKIQQQNGKYNLFENFLYLRTIDHYPFKGFIYLKKDKNGQPLFPLQLMDNTDDLIDNEGKEKIEKNRINPLYDEFDVLMDGLNNCFEETLSLKKDDNNLILNQEIRFQTLLDRIDAIVWKMLTENPEIDKNDLRTTNSMGKKT